MYKNALKEDLIRVVENLDGTVESTDTIVKLKTKIENSSTFESDPDFVKTLIQNCIDERVSRNEREVTLEKQKIELAKLQLAQLEKEIELQTAKNKALSLNPAAKVEDKQFKTLNKETATHIGIREAEDWFRPINLAKECDIYISSRSGSHKEIPVTYGYTQDPFKYRSQNFKPKIKENYPQNLERENKNCYICGDSSHYARDCKERFKPKESHIHNRINVNTLKIESEKQNSDDFANLQYINIFVENQPVTALIDSGCQIPVLNSSLIRVQTPSEEIITLSSCFGEQRMVEVKPINLSLNQHSTSLSVRTAISPTLTEEIIIHPSVYSEIKELGHAKSDVLLNESESSLGAHACVHFNSNVSVSNVIENSSYDLPHVKNFNTRNDLSSLIKDYKCNKIKSTKLKMNIKLKNDIPVFQRARRLSCSEKLQVNNQIDDWLRQGIIKESVFDYCSPIVLCKKVNGAMKTSSVEFISRSPTPSPMNSNYRRFVLLRRIFQPWQWKRRKKRNRFEQTSRTLERKISMRSTKDQLVKKDVLMPVKHNVFLWNLPDVEEMPSHDGETVQFSSGIHGKEKKEYVPLRTADSQDSSYGMQPKARQSSRAGAAKTRTETFELVEEKQKLLDIREKKKRESAKFSSATGNRSVAANVSKRLKLFDDKFVSKISFTEPDCLVNDDCFIQGFIKAEMKKRMTYKPYVQIRTTCQVIRATCTCPAGGIPAFCILITLSMDDTTQSSRLHDFRETSEETGFPETSVFIPDCEDRVTWYATGVRITVLKL
ncbi:transposon Tf2-9 polyprotein [Trichonephila clavipes]|nr:transposon Tf2-9 polyprotein [Trichonephila clavipes]